MNVDVMIIDCGIFRRETIALAPAYTPIRAGIDVIVKFGKRERKGTVKIRTTVDTASSEYRFIMRLAKKKTPLPMVVAFTERTELVNDKDRK